MTETRRTHLHASYGRAACGRIDKGARMTGDPRYVTCLRCKRQPARARDELLALQGLCVGAGRTGLAAVVDQALRLLVHLELRL